MRALTTADNSETNNYASTLYMAAKKICFVFGTTNNKTKNKQEKNENNIKANSSLRNDYYIK